MKRELTICVAGNMISWIDELRNDYHHDNACNVKKTIHTNIIFYDIHCKKNLTLKITVLPVPIFSLDNDVRVLPAIEVEEEEEELILMLWLRFRFRLRGDWLLERGTEWLGRPDTTSPAFRGNKVKNELKINEKLKKNKVVWWNQ